MISTSSFGFFSLAKVSSSLLIDFYWFDFLLLSFSFSLICSSILFLNSSYFLLTEAALEVMAFFCSTTLLDSYWLMMDLLTSDSSFSFSMAD